MSSTIDRLETEAGQPIDAGIRRGVLDPSELFDALQDPALNSMNFLNEIANRYPQAVSLAAGRPFEEFFEIGSLDRYLRRFCQYLSEDLGYSDEQVRRALFQYGRTKGIVHGLVAANLDGTRASGSIRNPSWSPWAARRRCSWYCGRCASRRPTYCSRWHRPMSG